MNSNLYAAQGRAQELQAEARRAREIRAALAERSVRFQLTHFLTLIRQTGLR